MHLGPVIFPTTVESTLGEWSPWSDCPSACGGQRTRGRSCTTNNGDVLVWSTVNTRWEFDTQGQNYAQGCFCSGSEGYETQQCGEDCKYSAWSNWGACTVAGQPTICTAAGEAGSQAEF